MSMEVHQFLNDSNANFAQTAPRPPVPGEENELQSNGGTSTRSSGSYKSQISAKSHSSNKSAGSKCSDVSHSPAATPRKSNLDRTIRPQEMDPLSDHCIAPLGFEPEGSVSSSPHFTESTNTPPYMKWAESLKYLLDDRDGIRLFKQFLDQENCTNTLDFLFACRGFKLVEGADKERIQNVAKVIYKKYIKGENLNLRQDVKKSVVDKLKKDQVDQRIFEEAQRDVEAAMRADTYPLFLKSDLYVQYVQNGGESPKTSGSNNSSGSNSVRPLSGVLPTLKEGEVLKEEDFKRTSSPEPTLVLTPSALMATRNTRARELWGNRHRDGRMYPPSKKMTNPYHVSYATVSAQDSELQSLSSDALTDDTMSLTDSSVDGRELAVGQYSSKAAYKKAQKAVRRNAKNNPHTGLTQFIPRTDRAPKDRNLSEKEPSKFASMLIERLQMVKEERDKLERVYQSIGNIEQSDDSLVEGRALPVPPKASSTSSSSLPLGAILATAIYEKDASDVNADSILDDHVSRIWDSSNGQTPCTRSPGRHSPGGHSPERASRIRPPFPTPNTSTSVLLPGGASSSKHHHRRGAADSGAAKDTSVIAPSHDGGVEDRTGVYYQGDRPVSHHKHIYHYHHYHHHVNTPNAKDKSSSSSSRVEPVDPTASRALQHYPSTPVMPSRTPSADDSHNRSQSRSRESKRTNRTINVDTSAPVLLPADPMHLAQVPSIHDPASEKVMAWMMDNEKVSHGNNTQYSTDGSDRGSSHKRSSHKSTSSQSQRTSSSKKGQVSSASFTASHNSSLERSHLYPAGKENASFSGVPMSYMVQPTQPIIQDPCMPLLTPPNPTTQLEEARRRLVEDEHKASKNKSFSGMSSSKDKRAMPPPPLPPRAPRTSNIPQVAPLDLSSSEEYSSSSQKSEKRSRKSSSVPVTPSVAPAISLDSTVIAYFMCNEPIPYRTSLPGCNITLSQFKQLIGKKGSYRYFFKKACDEFESGMVYEEMFDDDAILPIWDGKVIGKVDKVE